MLGLDENRLNQLGVSVFKPAMIWPLEPTAITAFAHGKRELLFVEEKTAFMEPQAAHLLFNLESNSRPRIVGKRDDRGTEILPSDIVLEPLQIALVIGARIRMLGLADAALEARLTLLSGGLARVDEREKAPLVRIPYFCSGCPHNTSTKVPEGSVAMAGIGCHTMAIYMNRSTAPPTQMGGEGMNWTGIAPFSNLQHVFQNLGDGTYFHSGLLAIRAAVSSGANITYKILYNDAVAMTGGQRVEGGLSVTEISHQLRAERVQRIAVVTDEPLKYGASPGFAAHTTIHHRDDLDMVQRELREVPGVSAIIYDQTCAAEKRRRRKRGAFANPDRRVIINELICEGCGDCSSQANCVSIEPKETEFGRKRKIDQSSCNKDYSCIKGFCPSFITVEGAVLKKPPREVLGAELFADIPEPARAACQTPYSILVTGIGGTGVVTVGAVLGMAAHLDGLGASVYDVTGLAQKNGAVMSHIKVAADAGMPTAPRVGALEADVLIGCDLVVAASADVLKAIDAARTRALINTHLVPTAAFQLNPDIDFETGELLATLDRLLEPGNRAHVDANSAALKFLGDTLGTNMLMVGYAMQKGWMPVSRAAVERAIELNGAAVQFNLQALALGRLAAFDPKRFAAMNPQASAPPDKAGESLDSVVAVRERFLAGYQNSAYAARYRALLDRVARAEQGVLPECRQLTDAVARAYFKLLAYKDEYEVARLHSGAELRAQLNGSFEPGYRLRFHLAPPGLAPADPVTGLPRKREYGGWMMPLFGVLARLRFLRGTVFDPFGYASERRMERRLIAEYEGRIEELIGHLSPQRHALAVRLASLPEQVRGFGHVKAANIEQAKKQEYELLALWRAAVNAD
jgi:indolepyruvate ferredoxin oxidoreductase